jgi:hypothetical protein
MNRKAKIARDAAFECVELLQPEFDKLAKKLQDPMQLSHFLCMFENLLAIHLNTKIASLSVEKKKSQRKKKS